MMCAMAEKDAKQIESIEHNPASAQHAFPPFDKQNFPSQLFWLALTFIALYLLMSRIALPRISSILDARRQRIESDLAEAQRIQTALGEEVGAAVATSGYIDVPMHREIERRFSDRVRKVGGGRGRMRSPSR